MKISLYDFAMMTHQVKELIVHAWRNDENGIEVCDHFTLTDKFDHKLWTMKDYEVIQFKATKKNSIDIICANF